MYCLKCGRETEGQEIFCGTCLTSMDQYPVKPGTPIHLPRRDTTETVKKPNRTKRIATPEEQVVFLKKVILCMGIMLIFAVLVLAGAMALLEYL